MTLKVGVCELGAGKSNMPKVLVVAYIFPPIGGSGVQRTVKFVKYLAEFGWQPVVLSVSNPPLSEMDYSLLEELPDDLPVHRTPYLDLLGSLRKSARRLKLIGRRPTARAKP